MRAITPASIVAALSAAALALGAAPPASAAACPNANAHPGQRSPQALATATICLLNQQRAARGLAPLSADAPLGRAARRYASYMVSTDRFAHQDAAGHDVVYRVVRADPALAHRWRLLGENLGWGTYSMASPRAMVQGWMNSPPHRANILCARFRQIGVGVAPGAPVAGARDGLTYATVFANLTRG